MIQLFLILSFLSYSFDGFQIFGFAGYGVKTSDITLLMLFLGVLKKLIWDGEKLVVNKNLTVHFSVLLLFATLLSGIYPLWDGSGIAIVQYFKTLSHFIFVYFFIIVAFSYDLTVKSWNNVIKSLLIFSLPVNIFGIYQMFARAFDLPFAWLEMNNISMLQRGSLEVSDISQLSIQFMNLYRATSIFTEPSVYSSFNTIVFIFVAIPFIQKREMFFKNKYLNASILFFIILGLVATFSLTALLAFMCILLGILIFEKRTYLKNLLIGILITLPFLALTDVAVENYTGTSPIGLFVQRVEGIVSSSKGVNKELTGESYSYRLQIIGTSIEVWEKSMLFGCGLGNFYLNQKRNILFAQDSFWSSVAETGIIGAFAFVGIFVSIFYLIFKIRNNPTYYNMNSDQSRLLNIALYVTIQLFAVNFFTTNFFVFVNLWFYVGLAIFAINNILKQSSTDNIIISFISMPLKDTFHNSIKNIKV